MASENKQMVVLGQIRETETDVVKTDNEGIQILILCPRCEAKGRHSQVILYSGKGTRDILPKVFLGEFRKTEYECRICNKTFDIELVAEIKCTTITS